jgi:hypothetical protein
MQRGFDFSQPRLYVLDGGKALHAAVKKYATTKQQCKMLRMPMMGRRRLKCSGQFGV